jgi:hypothetical protein
LKRFVFPFERLMEWRERCAENERVKLQQLHGLRSNLAESRAQLDASILDASAPPEAGALAASADLQHLAGYVEALRLRERAVQTAQQDCHNAILTQTDSCLNADREHELLLRLRERKAAVWQHDFYRESEQTAADSWLAGRSRAGSSQRRQS